MTNHLREIMHMTTLICAFFNLFIMLPLWIWLFNRSIVSRRDSKRLMEMGLELFPRKVYLIWLTDKQNSPTMALIGCCRTEEKAKEYADGREYYIQEIEVM